MNKKKLVLLLFFMFVFLIDMGSVNGAQKGTISKAGSYGDDGLKANIQIVKRSGGDTIASETNSTYNKYTEEACKLKGGVIENKSDVYNLCMPGYSCKVTYTGSLGMVFTSCPSRTIASTTKSCPSGIKLMCHEPGGGYAYTTQFSCSCSSSSSYTYVKKGNTCPAGYTKGVPALDYYNCKTKVTTTVTNKANTIKGNMYSFSGDGETSDAYCIAPGKAFKTQEYCEDKSFDASNCKSSNESLDCGLAAIMSAAKEQGLSYGSTLIALRLWATTKGMADGMNEDYEYVSGDSFYSATASKVLSGYAGNGDPGENNLIYGTSASAMGIISPAFELFKSAASGSLKVATNEGTEVFLLEDTITKDKTEVTLIVSKAKNAKKEPEVTAKGNGIALTVGKPTSCGKTGGSGTTHWCYKINLKAVIDALKACVKEDSNETHQITLDVTVKGEGIGAGGYIRYLACSNPNTYQPMMVHTEKSCDNIKPGDPIPEDCEINKTFIVTLTCGAGKDCCPDSEMVVTNNVPTSCNQGTKGERKDPKMDCILNACNKGLKEKYNESSTYGVNQQVCKVYCREDIEFSMIGKKEVMAGMQFRYEIPGRVVMSEYLTSVVISRRQCATEIYYDEWKEQYKKLDLAVLNAWNNFKMWESRWLLNGGLYTRDAKGGGCSDCAGCNYPPVDIFYVYWEHPKYQHTNQNASLTITNANLSRSGKAARCSHGMKCTGGYSCGKRGTSCCGYSCVGNGGEGPAEPVPGPQRNITPEYNAAKNAYINALKQREQWIIDLQDCNYYSNGGSCGGPKFEFKTSDGQGNPTNASVTNVAKDKICDDAAQMGLTIDLTYGHDNACSNYEYSGTQELEGEIAMFKDPDNNNKWCDDKKCYAADSQLKGNTLEDHEYWYCSGQETGAQCKKEKIKLPVNYNASFKTVTEADHYTSRQYYTQLYTGIVKQSKLDENYISMGKNLYPVCVEAYSAKYRVDINYMNVGHYNKTNHDYYCTYDVFNNTTKYQCDKGETNCDNLCCTEEEGCYGEEVLDVCIPGQNYCANPPCPTGNTGKPDITNGFIFRNIDPSNMFPEREPSTNWGTTLAKSIIAEIEKNAANIWQTEPKYSYILDPSDLKYLKKYNKSKNSVGGYLDMSVICIEGDSSRCISTFLQQEAKTLTTEVKGGNY